jgi:hypothetical protein
MEGPTRNSAMTIAEIPTTIKTNVSKYQIYPYGKQEDSL